ncbi:hypothetical protein C2G38_2094399 [Gigaspora rosea]|uniref:Uncharacterized protein n=1 Tax=Gigaspora rosea TaxID=44941 RepID=A0A397UXS8_9GLOM|nr:hypothetical protein C2G38_2094399 [Gigaspora rosea]
MNNIIILAQIFISNNIPICSIQLIQRYTCLPMLAIILTHRQNFIYSYFLCLFNQNSVGCASCFILLCTQNSVRQLST